MRTANAGTLVAVHEGVIFRYTKSRHRKRGQIRLFIKIFVAWTIYR